MAYAEDEAGGLMNPRFARVRPDMTVDEAMSYLRRRASNRDHLLRVRAGRGAAPAGRGLVPRALHRAAGPSAARSDGETDRHPREHGSGSGRPLVRPEAHVAIPVVDAEGHIKGIVTVDDIVDVVQEEATEDTQKFGGMEALDAPYLQIALPQMIKKRAGWLAALFLGEMLTATAMAFFENEIARAVVLALFVPLIISSGGNSGSQASTLVIRAMALGEVRLRDWWRVVRREFRPAGLGAMLASSASCASSRGSAWSTPTARTTCAWPRPSLSAWSAWSMFGTMAGSMLPFMLRRLGFDPASASAPFVATLVDVTGLVIYFTMAAIMLRGTLL